MGWQYDYKIRDQRGASSGTALLSVCSMFRIAPEGSAGQRDTDSIVPYRHGMVGDARKYSSGMIINAEGDLRYTTSSGTVTHTNGGAGHVHENKELLMAMLMGPEVRWLGRNDPHAGRVEIPCEVVMPPTTTTPRHRVFMQFRTLWPYWSEETQRTALSSPITLAGTAPVADAVLKIVGGTGVKVTHVQTGDYFQIEGATPAGGIYIDCGTRKSTNVTGGASAEWQVEKSAPYWMQLEPGTVSFTVTGGGTLTVDLYEQHR